VDERARSVVRESSGRCAAGACGRTTVRRVVVGRTRLRRDGVGSGAACHELVRDSIPRLRPSPRGLQAVNQGEIRDKKNIQYKRRLGVVGRKADA
jgi:hypothetical protein